jgi:hypothetical protein
VLKRVLGLLVVSLALMGGQSQARPVRAAIVNEQFFLAMTVRGCPCKGQLTGRFSAVGAVSERGTLQGTFRIRPSLAVPTLSGTTTLTGADGRITIAYTGRLVATSQRQSDGSSDYGVGIGTWRVRGATGSYAQLTAGAGKFYATLAKNVVHASYLPG